MLGRLTPLVLLPLACSSAPDTAGDAIVASQVVNVVGVDDQGMDPSVVAVVGAGGQVCTGVLLADDVVLTARHCVSTQAAFACPSPAGEASMSDSPGSVHVFTEAPGPSVTWASAGLAILTPPAASACDGDIAALLLEWPISGAVPALVSQSGAALGSHVRTVGFDDRATEGAVTELLREHVPVLSVSATELAVGEATCLGESGAPAFDETTGEVVGILSLPGSSCGAKGQVDLFTRTDAFYALVEEALAWEPSLAATSLDGGPPRDAGKRTLGKIKKPPTDVGSPCSTGSDCGAGVCVTAEGGEYCSETCAPADRCPTDYTCVIAESGASVCIQS